MPWGSFTPFNLSLSLSLSSVNLCWNENKNITNVFNRWLHLVQLSKIFESSTRMIAKVIKRMQKNTRFCSFNTWKTVVMEVARKTLILCRQVWKLLCVPVCMCSELKSVNCVSIWFTVQTAVFFLRIYFLWWLEIWISIVMIYTFFSTFFLNVFF